MTSAELFNGKFEFEYLGRKKGPFKIELKSEKEFEKLLESNLMSRDLEWNYDVEENDGAIYAGFFRLVGKFKRLDLK